MIELPVLGLVGIEWAVFVLLFGGMLIGIQGERWRAAAARAEWKAKRGWGHKRSVGWPIQTKDSPVKFAPDAADQVRHVIGANFERRRLLSVAEERVFREAEAAVSEIGNGWRVMAQVCLGEILSSHDADAFRAINSKRVDMLIVGADSLPLAAIEYQGSGHFQKDAAARDAVKKEALRIAGVEYIEIKAGDRAADLKWAIAKLGRAAPVERRSEVKQVG